MKPNQNSVNTSGYISTYQSWLRCTYNHFRCCFSGVSVGASVFTITAMSIDRYMAIRHPMAFRKVFNRSTTLFVSIISWKLRLWRGEAVICRLTLNRFVTKTKFTWNSRQTYSLLKISYSIT